MNLKARIERLEQQCAIVPAFIVGMIRHGESEAQAEVRALAEHGIEDRKGSTVILLVNFVDASL